MSNPSHKLKCICTKMMLCSPESFSSISVIFNILEICRYSSLTDYWNLEREKFLDLTHFDAVIRSCNMIFLLWSSFPFKILFSFDEKMTNKYRLIYRLWKFDFSKSNFWKSSWPRGSDFGNFLNQSLVFVRLEKLTKIKSAVALVMKIWRQLHTYL